MESFYQPMASAESSCLCATDFTIVSVQFDLYDLDQICWLNNVFPISVVILIMGWVHGNVSVLHDW